MTPTPLSDNIPEERSRAAVQFRRRLRRFLLNIGLLVVAYLLIGAIRTDKVLARSTHGNKTIIVRLVSRTPFWAWPLGILEYTRPHRREYYLGSRLWSCVSGTLYDSAEANSAAVEWDWADIPTVLIDDRPQLICRYGQWSEVKRR
jgi:hypothetical protein